MRPVFIIGAARSGTKFLRSLLAFSSHSSVVPHDVNYVWRFGNERHPDDAIPGRLLTPNIRKFIRKQLPRLAAPTPAEAGMLIEKTVSNALRVDFVNAVYPEGRFVHLVRDGRDVIESALRMWNARLDWVHLVRKVRHFPLSTYRYAAWYIRNIISAQVSRHSKPRTWGPRYPAIDVDLASMAIAEVCARQWAESVRRADAHLRHIAADRRITIRYETLTQDVAEVERLCAFAGIRDSERILEGYRRTVIRPRGTRWPPNIDEVGLKRAYAIAAPELARLGYVGSDCSVAHVR